MTRTLSFDHFLEAQDDGVYERALEEITAGKKTSHWMWFVFPQIAGLGQSATSKRFALVDRQEATAYCLHDVLGARLYEATEAMLDWAGTLTAQQILGPVDAVKFKSSMTLFEESADDAEPFAQALDVYHDGARDEETLKRL